MADTITTKSTLQIEFAFVDGDTRTASMTNPKSTITSAEIEDLNTFIRANNLVIGDRYSATFAQINTAKKVTKTTSNLDIT